MKRDILFTLKGVGYFVFFIPYCIVGLFYKPLNFIMTKCKDFDA